VPRVKHMAEPPAAMPRSQGHGKIRPLGRCSFRLGSWIDIVRLSRRVYSESCKSECRDEDDCARSDGRLKELLKELLKNC
jgi:hypothetical protein